MTKKLTTKREVIREILNNLEAEHGSIDTQHVVDIARSEDSVLHNYFQWEDGVAAEQYRKMQARMLINSIRVEIIPNSNRKAFFSIKVENPVNAQDRKYFSRLTIEQTPAMQDRLIKTALQSLKHWVETYREIAGIRGIVNEVELNKLLLNK